jgi:hypothetical protein
MEDSMLRAATRLLLVVGSAAIGAAGAMALRADLLVGYGFGKALHAQQSAPPFELALGHLENAEVGDEGYWLTRTTFAAQAAFEGHLAVGNHITVSGRDGRTRTLEVADITMVGAPLLKVADDGAPVQLMRVTARVVGTADARRHDTVRFYVEVEPPKPARLPSPQAQLGGT